MGENVLRWGVRTREPLGEDHGRAVCGGCGYDPSGVMPITKLPAGFRGAVGGRLRPEPGDDPTTPTL